MSLDREALARAVAEKSPLSLTQIEKLFGGAITPANKATVWRTINMQRHQQESIWQVYLRIKHYCPDTQVEAIT